MEVSVSFLFIFFILRTFTYFENEEKLYEALTTEGGSK